MGHCGHCFYSQMGGVLGGNGGGGRPTNLSQRGRVKSLMGAHVEGPCVLIVKFIDVLTCV